jgi:hypothetical protein
MGRHQSTISRHGRFLRLTFGKPEGQPVRRDERVELRRQRRQLEDELDSTRRQGWMVDGNGG